MQYRYKVFLFIFTLTVLILDKPTHALSVDIDLAQGQTLTFSYNQDLPNEFISGEETYPVTMLQYSSNWDNLSDDYIVKASVLDSDNNVIAEKIYGGEYSNRVNFHIYDDEVSGSIESSPFRWSSVLESVDIDPYLNGETNNPLTYSIEMLQGSLHLYGLYFSYFYVESYDQSSFFGRTVNDSNFFDINLTSSNPEPVPEPATIFLLGSGLIGFFFKKRKA